MIRSRSARIGWAALLVTFLNWPGSVIAAEAPATVLRIAFIDPLSGLMAATGNQNLQHFQFLAEVATREHWAPGVKFEIVPFDNKLSPQESLVDLKAAIDQDIHYVVQGNGSNAARALIGGVAKNNERSPGKEVVYLNYSAVDPDLTNGECSFWHFRWDANSDQKMEGLIGYLARQKAARRVYLINQDYSFGHQVERASRELLARKRPDIEIVGNDFHALAKVTDFSQYVAKMKVANTDSVVTGNWGSDLSLLIKAAREAGLTANFYTLYAQTSGVATQMAGTEVDKVRVINFYSPNTEGHPGESLAQEFKSRYQQDFFVYSAYNILRGLADAIRHTGSTDPVRVAFALEGQKLKSLTGEVEMRASDHQLQQPLFVSSWQKADGVQVKYDSENTGFGWRMEERLPADALVLPTSCQMQRPPRPN